MASKKDSAIAVANAALEFLSELDEIVIQSSNLSMAPVFERVLTNNGMSPGTVYDVNPELIPQFLGYSFVKQISPSGSVSIDSIHASECYVESCHIEKDLISLNAYNRPVTQYEAQHKILAFVEKHGFNPVSPEVDNFVYTQNFTRPDLRDLYGVEV